MTQLSGSLAHDSMEMTVNVIYRNKLTVSVSRCSHAKTSCPAAPRPARFNDHNYNKELITSTEGSFPPLLSLTTTESNIDVTSHIILLDLCHWSKAYTTTYHHGTTRSIHYVEVQKAFAETCAFAEF